VNPGYFPYPLQLGVLDEFRHPVDGHLLARPVYHEKQVLVGNGYILLRIDRGLWMASDFMDAPAGFVERFMSRPWKPLDKIGGEWRTMDEIKPQLYRYTCRELWGETTASRNHCQPGPVWKLGPAFLGRLCHLQLIGRLPRVDVVLPQGQTHDLEPLRFRFSGGSGMLVADARLTESSMSLMQRRYAHDGHEVKRRATPVPNLGKAPAEEPRLEGWPPEEVD
jgi:hypothetical protein